MYDYEYEAQEDTVWTLVMQTRDAISQLSKKVLGKEGLTPEKWHVLFLCANCEEPLTIAELGRMLFRKPHTVSGLLTRMEAEGLVRKDKQNHQESEPMIILLTEHGSDVFARGQKQMVAAVRNVMESVPGRELDHLERGLRLLRNSILQEMNMAAHKLSFARKKV